MPGPVQRTVHNWGRRTKPVGEAILEKIKFIESTIGQDLRALLKDKYVSILRKIYTTRLFQSIGNRENGGRTTYRMIFV